MQDHQVAAKVVASVERGRQNPRLRLCFVELDRGHNHELLEYDIVQVSLERDHIYYHNYARLRSPGYIMSLHNLQMAGTLDPVPNNQSTKCSNS